MCLINLILLKIIFNTLNINNIISQSLKLVITASFNDFILQLQNKCVASNTFLFNNMTINKHIKYLKNLLLIKKILNR